MSSWKNEFAIGIGSVDAQHKELCDAVDKLFESAKSGKGKEETKKILQFLEQYVVKHFNDEEAIQQKCGYPGFAAHKKIHEDFKNTFAGLKKEAVSVDFSLPVMIKIHGAALAWLLHHIGDEDKKIGQFVKSKQAA